MRITGISDRDVVLSRGFITDPHCGFRLRPNVRQKGIDGILSAVHINSLGMRDREYSTTKPPGTIRILALGDSFAYGRVDYEFNFLTLLENQLNQTQTNCAVELLNAGVPAYQPINELAYLQHYGFAFHPDIVLLCFYVGNDLRANDAPASETHPEIPFQRMEKEADTLPFHSLLSWSELYWTLMNLYIRSQVVSEIQQRIPDARERKRDDPRRLFPDFGFMTEEQFRETLATQMRNHLLPQHRNDWDRENFANTVAVIRAMADLCRERSVRFGVALFPAEVQVDEEIRELFFEIIEGIITLPELSGEEPQQTLKQLLSESNIETIDLLPAFIEKGKMQKLYLLRDTHWNEAGNQLAAEVMYEIVNGWVRERFERE